MNKKQFEIWEKQKRSEYEIELSKLQEDMASHGLAYSGIRNKAEEDLKSKHDSEIEIARLEIEKDTNKFGTICILNKGRNNTFIGNTFQDLGVGIQDEGENTVAADNKFLTSVPNGKANLLNNIFWKIF